MADGTGQLRHGSREHSQGARSVTLILLAPVFLLALPCLFVGFGALVDRRMP